jgi:signal transduction histidine kinase
MIDREPVHWSDVESADRRSRLKRARSIAMPASEHVVRFYEADAALLEAVATFCGDALLAGDVAVVIATAEHRAGIAERMRARGLFDAAGDEERYLALDAAGTLSRFLVDGKVDAASFAQVVGAIVSRAAEHGREVKIFGEMVSLLIQRGNLAAAVHLEELWNDLRQTHDFSLLCAYPMEGFSGEARGELFRDVCEAHAQVIPTESYLSLPTADGRLRAIAELQQKAQSLQDEIAERQRVEERLEAALAAEQTARRESQDALHVRDEFMSIAAHELRNPLASLSLHAQVALRRLGRDEHLDAVRTELSLQAISEQAIRLSQLLDRLLDVSRLDAGQLALERRPTDLAILVEQAVASARVKTDRHPITLERPVKLDAEVDPLRLKQVLTNLLDNAVKYSPNGEPIVVILSQPAPGRAELAVIDHGIGIPLEARARIFERFFQARSGDSSQGLGLGLFVSQQIVRLHGGQIRVECPPHGGTRVVISLPTGMETIAELRAAG